MGSRADVPPPSAELRLRGQVFPAGRALVMAIVDRSPDAYGDVRADADALDAVDRAVDEGAAAVAVTGSGRGEDVDLTREMRRIVPFVERTRIMHPGLLIAVDTWHSAVAQAACSAGADLVHDTWSGRDPRLAEVAAAHGAGFVVSHLGVAVPHGRPHRVGYGDTPEGVVDVVLEALRAGAERAVAAGVQGSSVLVDPAHDVGKNTWHGLALVRRTEVLARLGHPVLMTSSRNDFVGETLDLPPDDLLEGTLAATAVAAWAGAKVFRVHDVRATRRVLDMVSSIRGDRPPAVTVRGLA